MLLYIYPNTPKALKVEVENLVGLKIGTLVVYASIPPTTTCFEFNALGVIHLSTWGGGPSFKSPQSAQGDGVLLEFIPNFFWGAGGLTNFHQQNPIHTLFGAFPTHFSSILYFTSSKSYFFSLTIHFYKTPHNLFSILQNISLK